LQHHFYVLYNWTMYNVVNPAARRSVQHVRRSAMLSESEAARAMIARLLRMKHLPALHTLQVTNERDGFKLRGHLVTFEPDVLAEIHREVMKIATAL
jgi:hypothetical protein